MYSMLVVKARIQLPSPLPWFQPVSLTARDPTYFLPNALDVKSIQNDMEVLVSRILCDYIKIFNCQKKSVVKHIPHEYSSEMAHKSEVRCSP